MFSGSIFEDLKIINRVNRARNMWKKTHKPHIHLYKGEWLVETDPFYTIDVGTTQEDDWNATKTFIRKKNNHKSFYKRCDWCYTLLRTN